VAEHPIARSPRRRRTCAALAALAAAATATGGTASATGRQAPPGLADPPPGARPTVVLVHGAFADASSWNQVVARLQSRGYPVVAPANPLRGLAQDSVYIASVLRSIRGTIILAGHSYGGAVISSAATGNPNVKALVFISALVPDKGEVLAKLAARYPGSELNPALRSVPFRNADGTTGTDLYIKPDRFRAVFAADLPAATTTVMAATQRPIAASAFNDAATSAAWRTIPSWALVAKRDKAIAPDVERFEARRAKSRTVEVDSSHVAMISHPQTVTDLILQAADAASPSVSPTLAKTGSGSSTAALGTAGGATVTAGAGLLLAGRRRRAAR
jgi:LPXTG-motif cell wall-anchored protein